MTIDDLRNLMCIPGDAGKEDVIRTFKRIAEALMNSCVIQYRDAEYRILDFEFYFYNKHHQDISVHPRESEALCWYINDFGGIDLNFKSDIKKEVVKNKDKWSYKYELTDDSFFGGILIRQIMRLSDGLVYDGPWKVADLFRTLDATSQTQKNPILVMKPLEKINFINKTRYNLLGSYKSDPKRKADYNLQECFMPVSESLKQDLENELVFFKGCFYRYCYQP